MQRSFQLLSPEAEELQQFGEFWKQVVVLPDECLKKRRMVWHSVEDLRGCQPVTAHLLTEVAGSQFPGCHVRISNPASSIVCRLPDMTSSKIELCSYFQGVSSITSGLLTNPDGDLS